VKKLLKIMHETFGFEEKVEDGPRGRGDVAPIVGGRDISSRETGQGDVEMMKMKDDPRN